MRTIVSLVTAALAALALSAAMALVVLAAFFHRAAGELAAAVESVRLAEAVQVDLLSYSHLHVPQSGPADVVRLRLEGALRRRMSEMHPFVGSPAEASLVRAMEESVERYLAAARSEVPSRAPDGRLATEQALDDAFLAVEHVVNLNVSQARAVQERAARWDRRATLGGSIAALVLLAGTAVILAWLRRAFAPILRLSDAMRRFGAGERSARAPETGPAELAATSRTFNEMAATLERQREAQLAFLGGIAHDLRNPLATLKLTAAVGMAEGPLGAAGEVRALFQRVDRQVAKLDRMVSDVLDAARVEAGRLSLELRRCDVRLLVSEVVDQHRPTAPAHLIEVTLPEGPVLVRCDPIRIEQVLANLMGNAIKYSPGGGRVRVGVTAEDGRATLSVADEGLGIPPEEQPFIFEPFHRGARHDGIPGMGLGLSVARRIVEAHGGALEVESTPGSGAVFRVRLPLIV